MLVIVGPSATGKSAIVRRLEENYGMKKFITCTTRPMRLGEKNGVDYYFMSVEEFQKHALAKDFIETVLYNGNYYGTLKKEASEDKVVILEPLGLRNFYQALDGIYSVYLETDEWLREQRMRMRGDSLEDIAKRLENDRTIFSNDELQHVDYILNTTRGSTEELAKKIYDAYSSYLKKSLL